MRIQTMCIHRLTDHLHPGGGHQGCCSNGIHSDFLESDHGLSLIFPISHHHKTKGYRHPRTFTRLSSGTPFRNISFCHCVGTQICAGRKGRILNDLDIVPYRDCSHCFTSSMYLSRSPHPKGRRSVSNMVRPMVCLRMALCDSVKDSR